MTVAQPDAISERMRMAAVRWPKPNAQELDHLQAALSRLSSPDCLAVLAGPFSVPDAGNVQEYAGRLLLRLRPRFPVDGVVHTIRRLLSHWDVSVEQLPWYVESVLDAGVLDSVLDQVESDSDATRRQVETFRFWLKVPSDQRGDQ
jgi:hypothetical protein